MDVDAFEFVYLLCANDVRPNLNLLYGHYCRTSRRVLRVIMICYSPPLPSSPLNTTNFLSAQRLFRPHPAPEPSSLSLLHLTCLRHPRISLKTILPCQRCWSTNIHSPSACNTWQGVLLGKHVQVPESDAGGHLDGTIFRDTRGGEADGRGELEVSEDGNASLRIDDGGVEGCRRRWSAAADAHELDLGHDEAIAATVLAHHAVQMREAL